MCERLDFAARVLDKADHQVAFTGATHHACCAGRGLRPDVMLVEESDAEPFAFAQIVCGGSAKAAGTDDNGIRLADHDAGTFTRLVHPNAPGVCQ